MPTLHSVSLILAILETCFTGKKAKLQRGSGTYTMSQQGSNRAGIQSQV